MSFIGMVLLFGVIASFYFLPSIVAHVNKKKDATAIFLINLFAGWSAIGWFIALYLAIRRDSFRLEHKNL